MDIVDSSVLTWLTQYGSLTLLGLLALGIVGLPIPDETLLTLSGALMSQGRLPILETLCAAYGGSLLGISGSYILGRMTGYFLLHRYGRWVGITEKKIQYAHTWFARFGKWTLVFGYFIPGVRHLTGYIAGATQLEFPVFARFAYSGAVMWVSLFLGVGYTLGEHVNTALVWLENSSHWIGLSVIVIAVIAYGGWIVYRYRCKRRL